MDEHTFPVTFEIKRAVERQRVVLTLIGELDLNAAPELEAQLSELDGEAPLGYLVDMSGVTFIDSSGLAVIIRAQRAADANGHKLAFRQGSPQVQRLLELTGTTDRLSFEDWSRPPGPAPRPDARSPLTARPARSRATLPRRR